MRTAASGLAILLLAATAVTARAGTYDAPLDTRAEGDVKFSAAPKAEAAGDRVKISFAVSAPTDVEVAIIDAKSNVVRHLAAGLLGKNAPEPFKKDSLSQEVLWDRKDDCGKLPPSTIHPPPFRVRISLGARPKIEKHAGWDGNSLGGVLALAVGPGGEVFVVNQISAGGSEVRVLDKSGKYLRTIMPYSAATPKERSAGVGHLDVEGERLPIVFNSVGRSTYPLTCGLRAQNMAWHPKGHLVMFSALGTITEQGPPRHLLALHPEGGAPEGLGFVGPRLLKPRGKLGGAGEMMTRVFDHLAISPDGEWLYVARTQSSKFDGKGHGVLRLKWTDAEAGELFLGKPEPGADDEHFNGPEGLAVDAKGNLYVCDWGNNRVMIFSAEGKLLGKFAADKPQQIAVHPAGGDIYVMSRGSDPKYLWGGETVIRKFAPWGKGEPKELAKLDLKGMDIMALDSSATPARLWVSSAKGLFAVNDKGAALEPGDPVTNRNGVECPWFIAADPERDRVLLYERAQAYTSGPGIVTMSLADGKKTPFSKGTAMATDRAGNVYVMNGYGSNTISRYDPAGKPLAFEATGTNKITTGVYRAQGPNVGLPGLAVAANGDIYVMRTSGFGETGDVYGGRVDVYGPDGKLKTANLVDGLTMADCGLGADAAGNVYVGANVKPADQPFPAAFMGKVPAKGWVWWNKGPEREKPWCYTYFNPYLLHWGSVLKFGPAGGTLYGTTPPWKLKEPKYQPKPADTLAAAPADAVSYRTAYLGWEVKVAGALWRYPGFGLIPGGDINWGDPGCTCHQAHLAVDEYGRVFVPDCFRFSVEMLDTNGNQIARIGRYGNADDNGGKISFVWPAFVSLSGGKMYVSDAGNRRITVVGFDHAAEESCEIR